MANIDIDKIVNYQREYAGAIEKPQVSGSRLTGLCPFHADKNASFSADLKTGRFNCFACGASGNYIDFVANRFGMDTKDAYKKILADYGIAEQKKPKEKVSDALYNVEIYAEEKKLPEDWLAKTFSLSAGKERSGQHYVKIPYFNEDCQPVVFRKRYPKDAPMRFKWSQGSAGKLMLYGLWSLKTVHERGYVILVEGESDTHTLWYLGLPTLGVPGASTYRPEWSEKLKGLKLYLHIEPDQGGKTFLEQMTKKLRDGGFVGEVYTWSCSAAGVKDPSALFMEKGRDEAKAYIETALKGAKKIDIYDIPEAIKGAPVRLRQPDGWKFSEQGINMIDAKTFESKCICRTPILLTRRLKSSETGDEKIEIAFLRDGQWKYVSRKRSEIFQAKSIVSLADEGCTITSENAKYVVRFLQALEEENIDIIEVVESTSSFGWQSRNRFLPGHADGLVLDIDPSTRMWASSYCMNGSLKGWVDMVAPLRENDKFRFILAGSFAAPLLRILKQRIFFIYNWGSSKGGKTSAIKAALSAWGDPEGLMTSFNSTQVGLERAAAFFSDLPMGIDERQLAGQKQESLEKLVYMLASGQGKLRGAKTGGIQAINVWKTVILASGEEPILRETSQTGVGTRMIELIGAPFDSEEAARAVHLKASDNCGWAGPAFMSYVLEQGDDFIISMYEDILSCLQDDTKMSGAHIASIAVVTVADILAGEAIFNKDKLADNTDRALAMARHIAKDIKDNEPPDVNVSALNFILDWMNMNSIGFTEDARERLGFVDEYDNICIFPTALRNALEKEGFSSRKTIKFLLDEGYIVPGTRDGKITSSPLKKFNGKPCRVICFATRKLESEGYQLDFIEVNPSEVPEF